MTIGEALEITGFLLKRGYEIKLFALNGRVQICGTRKGKKI